MNIDNFFQDIIRLRGIEIYNNNLVFSVFKDESTIYSVVKGMEYYNVTLDIKDKKIVGGTCTCKYQDNCKHMAALAYYVENNFKSSSTEIYLNMLTKQELIDIIISNKRVDITINEYRHLLKVLSVDEISKILKSMIKIDPYKVLYLLNITIDYHSKDAVNLYLNIFNELVVLMDKITLADIVNLLTYDYLIETIGTILVINQKNETLYELINYIDDLIIKGNINYKTLKLKILLSFDKTSAVKYARANLDFSEYFLKVFTTYEKNYSATIKEYLINYSDSFGYSYETLEKYLEKGEI